MNLTPSRRVTRSRSSTKNLLFFIDSPSVVGFCPVQLYLQLSLLRSAVGHMRQRDTCRIFSRIRYTVSSSQNTRQSEGKPQVRADRGYNDLHDPSRGGDTLVLRHFVRRIAPKPIFSLAGRHAMGDGPKRFLPICFESTSRFCLLSLHLPFSDREQV